MVVDVDNCVNKTGQNGIWIMSLFGFVRPYKFQGPEYKLHLYRPTMVNPVLCTSYDY